MSMMSIVIHLSKALCWIYVDMLRVKKYHFCLLGKKLRHCLNITCGVAMILTYWYLAVLTNQHTFNLCYGIHSTQPDIVLIGLSSVKSFLVKYIHHNFHRVLSNVYFTCILELFPL